jgi:hypothetical protein
VDYSHPSVGSVWQGENAGFYREVRGLATPARALRCVGWFATAY